MMVTPQDLGEFTDQGQVKSHMFHFPDNPLCTAGVLCTDLMKLAQDPWNIEIIILH